MKKLIVFSLLFSSMLISCSKDEPTSVSPQVYKKVEIGAEFTYTKQYTDSNSVVISGLLDTLISTVVQTNATFHNKSSTFKIEEQSHGYRDTATYAYETNNNVSMLLEPGDLGLAPFWVTLPTASQGTLVTISADSAEVDPGVFAVMKVTVTSQAKGTEGMTLGSETIQTKKISMTIHAERFVGGVKGFDLSITNELYYASSLGTLTKMVLLPVKDVASGQWMEGSVQTLVSVRL